MFKSALILVTGAGASQLILLIASPLITRVFSPTEFGAFVVFAAVASTLSVIAAGTYEQAIVVARQSKWAANLLALSLILSIVFASLVLFIVITLIIFQKSSIVQIQIDAFYVYLPAALFAGCVNSIMIQWLLREGGYRLISIARIFQSLGVVALQLGLPVVISAKSDVLVYGYIFGLLASAVILGFNSFKLTNYSAARISFKSLALVSMRFSDFPKFMIVGQFANVLSSSLLIVLMGILYGAEIAGFCSLAYRVLAAPTALLINAFGEVYKTESAKVYNISRNCRGLFLKSARSLAIYSAIPALVFLFFGETIFAAIFGEKWKGAGGISSILAVLIYFQCVSTPLASTVLLANLQRYDMWWQILRVLCCGGGIFLGYFYESYYASITIYVIALSLLYVLHFFIQFKVASGFLGSDEK
jgi:O-antigen/teichoic acid export membrane protein